MILPVLILIVCHGALCAAVLAASVTGLMRVRPAAYPMVLLVPVFGPLSAAVLDIAKKRKSGTADIEVDHFRVEARIYRSMGMTSDENTDVVSLEEAMILNSGEQRRSLMMDLMKEHVVPLEEALSVSSSDVRRKLMMDILTSDASAFYSLLEQARLNDDVEVVHYATTAMTELNKQYDTALQKYRDLYRADPADPEKLRRLCDCLRQYLALGLAKGRIAESRRKEYIDCLTELVRLCPEEETCGLLASQLLAAEDFERADEALRLLEDSWPAAERTWMLRLEYYARRKDRVSFRRTLREASANGIYFSAEARERLRFWRGEKNE